MNKPPKALLDAIDQMEQLPGIAGVFSEVRLQIFRCRQDLCANLFAGSG